MGLFAQKKIAQHKLNQTIITSSIINKLVASACASGPP